MRRRLRPLLAPGLVATLLSCAAPTVATDGGTTVPSPPSTEEAVPEDGSVTVIQDTDRGTEVGQVELSDGWFACTTTCDKAPDGAYQWTRQVGATATVRFSGTGVAVFGVKEEWSHVATVSIDGGEPVDVDFFAAPATAAPVEVFRSPQLEDATHALVLTMTERRNPASTGGDAITFDRAEITGGDPGGEPPAPSTTAAPTTEPPTTEVPPPSTAPPTTPGTAPITGNLSGLTWASGIGHPNQTRANYDSFGAWRGRPIDVAKVFPARDSWDTIVGPGSFIYGNFDGFPGRLAVAVPLFPKSGSLGPCAAGQYDGQWATFGRSLVGHGRGDSIVQLGWEFNGDYGFWWNATDTNQWIQCFRKAATAIRSTAPDVLIDWTMNGHATPSNRCGGNAWNCYPGDAYVDVVGIHDYDHYPAAPTQQAFDARANGNQGLNAVHEFAKAHGKWMSVLEWGVDHNTSRGANVGGDNALYIQLQLDWFAAHDVESGGRLIAEAYFDDGCVATNTRSTLSAGCGNPNAAAAYNGRI